MEKSILFDLLDNDSMYTWKEEAAKNDDCGFKKREKDLMDRLTAELNGKGKQLLEEYAFAIENKWDYVYYNVNIKILNLGLKIGMELQRAFTDLEEI